MSQLFLSGAYLTSTLQTQRVRLLDENGVAFHQEFMGNATAVIGPQTTFSGVARGYFNSTIPSEVIYPGLWPVQTDFSEFVGTAVSFKRYTEGGVVDQFEGSLSATTTGLMNNDSATGRAVYFNFDLSAAPANVGFGTWTVEFATVGSGTGEQVAGPQGPIGPQGPKGDKGDTGDTGVAGPKGDTGAQGDKGDAGVAGAAGVSIIDVVLEDALSGVAGSKDIAVELSSGQIIQLRDAFRDGLQGDQGLKGDQGDQGVRGQTGAAGDDGMDGAAGTPGVNGINGTDGADGAKGDRGDGWYVSHDVVTFGAGNVARFSGVQNGDLILGLHSSQLGDVYVVDSLNATGDTAILGDPGNIRGPEGPQGVPGADGAPGLDGLQGPAGPAGSLSGVEVGEVAVEDSLVVCKADGTYVCVTLENVLATLSDIGGGTDPTDPGTGTSCTGGSAFVVDQRTSTGQGGYGFYISTGGEIAANTALASGSFDYIEINNGSGTHIFDQNNLGLTTFQRSILDAAGFDDTATLTAQTQGGNTRHSVAGGTMEAFNIRFAQNGTAAGFVLTVGSVKFVRGSGKVYVGGTGSPVTAGPGSTAPAVHTITAADYVIEPTGTYRHSTTSNVAPFDFIDRVTANWDVGVVCS